jgi:SAM-dependent methyltransferase
MEPKQQKAYWDNRIVSWDSSIYAKQRPLPWIERLAAPFRSNLRARQEYAVNVISRVAPKKLLEVSCGTGELIASLPPGTSLTRYVGIDISSVSIDHARMRDYSHLPCAPEFISAATRDVDPASYADFDFVLMLGLMPYITDDEFATTACLIREKGFLFDYHLADASVWNLMHWCYRQVAKHPFYRMHSDAAMSELLRQNGVQQFDLVHRRRVAFVEHLPTPGPG